MTWTLTWALGVSPEKQTQHSLLSRPTTSRVETTPLKPMAQIQVSFHLGKSLTQVSVNQKGLQASAASPALVMTNVVDNQHWSKHRVASKRVPFVFHTFSILVCSYVMFLLTYSMRV